MYHTHTWHNKHALMQISLACFQSVTTITHKLLQIIQIKIVIVMTFRFCAGFAPDLFLFFMKNGILREKKCKDFEKNVFSWWLPC
jgi:hypothetical protein